MAGVEARPGALVAGRYRLEVPLGEGGFGAVFRALDLSTRERVAVKVLVRSVVDMGPRFRREAELAMRLSHPNTVRTLDAGEDPRLGPFIVLELLEGQSLDGLLRTQGALDPRRVAAIALAILASLEEAHGRGIVHRDIKPANVFLVREPTAAVKVLDFGIAKSTNADTRAGLTQEGQTVGTPAYMAPEQVTGGALGPETDLYALGLLMAEALGGSSVYQGREPLAVLVDKLDGKPVPIADAVLRSPLGPVITRAVAHAREGRFPHAAAMRGAIQEAVAAMPDETFQPGALHAAVHGSTPHRLDPAAAMAAAAPTWSAPLAPPTAVGPFTPPLPVLGPPLATPARRAGSSGLWQGCLLGLGMVTGLGALAVVAGVVWLGIDLPATSRRTRPPPAPATVNAPPPPTPVAPVPVARTPTGPARQVACPRLARLAPSQLNQRIRDAGWTVGDQAEMRGDVTTITFGLLRNGVDVGQLVFHEGPEPHAQLAQLQAGAAFDVSWAIAGRRLLFLAVASDAPTLLAAIC